MGFVSDIIGGITGANDQADAAKDAASTQAASAQAGIDLQREQFNKTQGLLSPYAQAGTGSPGTFNGAAYLAANPDVAADPYYSQHPEEHYTKYGQNEGRQASYTGNPTQGSLGAQQDLLGLNGAGAQGSAINGIQSSPMFTSLLDQGENSIRQNASATGGLRGGNTQAALAQFSPRLLAQLIQQQFSNLGGLTSIGQNAAAGTGNAGATSANNISNLLQQQGAATAGGQIAAGNAGASGFNSLLKLGGTVASFF